MRIAHAQLQRDVVAHVRRRLRGMMVSSARDAGLGLDATSLPTATVPGERSLRILYRHCHRRHATRTGGATLATRGRRRGGEGDEAGYAEHVAQRGDPTVAGTEVVTPRADAVRLVDG